MPTKKTAPKKTACRKEPKPSPKARKPSQLDRIEVAISKVHEELLSVRSIAHHARTAARVNTSKLDLLLSGATFMQELDKAKEEPKPLGLQPGDYTDASKETADALTAMGWEWWDDDRHKEKYIRFGQNSAKGKMVNINQMGATCHLTPAEFLSRAAVTAKEIGLVPVMEKWVPAPGEWVRDESCIGKAVEVDRGLVSIDIGPKNVWRLLKRVAKPTDAEVQQHLADQEAKNPVEFGTRVEYQDDKGWRVACNEADKHGWWVIVKPSTRSVCSAKRHEFTVIDPQP